MDVRGIMTSGNDGDILELSIRHNLSKLNELMVIDNNSTDGSKEIIENLMLEYNGRLKTINVNHSSSQEFVIMSNFIKEQIKLSDNQPDYLFFLDADEFIDAKDFSELELIPDNCVGIAKWKCYIPTRLDHKNFPDEMLYRRDSEPLGCHKVVIPKHCNGFLTLGNHYLHQRENRAEMYELKTISLAHYPVRSVDQMNNKIKFANWISKDENSSQTFHLRSSKQISTLEDLIEKAMTYSDITNSTYKQIYDPLND